MSGRIALAAAITAAVVGFFAISTTDEGNRLGLAIAGALAFGCIVAGLVLVWGWALE